MRRIFGLCVLLLSVTTVPSTAQDRAKPQNEDQDLINPDRPGIADGSMTIGRHPFQIETAMQKEFRSGSGSTEHRIFLPTLLRLGFSDTWEGRIEGNSYTWTRTSAPGAGMTRTDGYSPLSLGFKYHQQDMKGTKRPSIGGIFRLFVPSGSADFGSHRFQGDLRLAADQNLTSDGAWALNPNVGVGVYDDGNTGVFTTGLFAMTVNYFNKAKTLNPFIDIGVQGPEEKRGRTSAIIDGGAAYIVGRDVQLDVSVGTGILGRTPPHPFWALGISIRR